MDGNKTKQNDCPVGVEPEDIEIVGGTELWQARSSRRRGDKRKEAKQLIYFKLAPRFRFQRSNPMVLQQLARYPSHDHRIDSSIN